MSIKYSFYAGYKSSTSKRVQQITKHDYASSSRDRRCDHLLQFCLFFTHDILQLMDDTNLEGWYRKQTEGFRLLMVARHYLSPPSKVFEDFIMHKTSVAPDITIYWSKRQMVGLILEDRDVWEEVLCNQQSLESIR